MAVNNSLTQMTPEQNNRVVEYQVGNETVKLTPTMIRHYLVRGYEDAGQRVTDQEVMMFLNLCKFQHLNPFLNEAYLIKFGNQPATIVTGKEAITKRAMRNKTYEGQQAGVVIYHEDKEEFEYRTGSMVMQGEKLVGGWAKVYVKGYQHPIEAVVGYNEYVGLKDGQPNQQWARKPGTMIRKVALVQALREAFPEDLGGMYDSSEMGVDFDETGASPTINIPQEEFPQDNMTPPEFFDSVEDLENFPMDELEQF